MTMFDFKGVAQCAARRTTYPTALQREVYRYTILVLIPVVPGAVDK